MLKGFLSSINKIVSSESVKLTGHTLLGCITGIVDSGGGGAESLAPKCATHPRPPTYKMDPKWRITPGFICTPKWHHTGLQNITLNGVF